jgi:hypothetical protein
VPMIDVYSVTGTFADKHRIARDLAAAVMHWEKVPELALFKKNTATFVHDLPADCYPMSTATATTCASKFSHRLAYWTVTSNWQPQPYGAPAQSA